MDSPGWELALLNGVVEIPDGVVGVGAGQFVSTLC